LLAISVAPSARDGRGYRVASTVPEELRMRLSLFAFVLVLASAGVAEARPTAASSLTLDRMLDVSSVRLGTTRQVLVLPDTTRPAGTTTLELRVRQGAPLLRGERRCRPTAR